VFRRTANVEEHMKKFDAGNKEVGHVITGTHNNQAKILEQLEDMRTTQRILSVGLGVVGLSTLGYFGYKAISGILKRIRGRMKRETVEITNAPEMHQIGYGSIRKRSHARDFKKDEDMHIRAIF
jgi:hypothetical protein